MIITCFHGTNNSAANEIENKSFRASDRDGLWIGEGRYFFQDAKGHALDWARITAYRRSDTPALFEVKVDLMDCLDLIDNDHWAAMRDVHHEFCKDDPEIQPSLADYLEEPRKVIKPHYEDAKLIMAYTAWLKDEEKTPVRCIRATIPEGDPIHSNSWLLDKSCVMINVLDPDLIVDFKRIA